MSVKPKTIDNLGIESSVRYAKDMEILDQRLINESRLIPQKTEVAVSKPYVPSEFDRLFASGKTLLWATFSPPPEYYTASRMLFSYQLIPSLGGYEKKEAAQERLEAVGNALDKPNQKKKDQGFGGSDEEEKERQVLLALLKMVDKLDKTIALINSRRNQYQRG